MPTVYGGSTFRAACSTDLPSISLRQAEDQRALQPGSGRVLAPTSALGQQPRRLRSAWLRALAPLGGATVARPPANALGFRNSVENS